MERYFDVCLQPLYWFGSLDPSKTTLKELKQRRFIGFQIIPCSYDYHKNNMPTTTFIKLLCINIDDDLMFKEHI